MSQYAQTRQIRFARQPVVMVVEDDILIRFPIAEHLRGLRFTVIEAGSGAEAIDLLRSSDDPVDVVFTDLQMPGPIDGVGIVRWIIEHDPGISIILTSGDENAIAAAAEYAGHATLVPKPYRGEEIANRIRALLAEDARW
jgi:DNA-binding response OmpR family regulator